MTQSSGGSSTIAAKVVAPDALCLADHPALGARLVLTYEKVFSTARYRIDAMRQGCCLSSFEVPSTILRPGTTRAWPSVEMTRIRTGFWPSFTGWQGDSIGAVMLTASRATTVVCLREPFTETSPRAWGCSTASTSFSAVIKRTTYFQGVILTVRLFPLT
jgi:hypothetical protein